MGRADGGLGLSAAADENQMMMIRFSLIAHGQF
jgi:hypothetical protein